MAIARVGSIGTVATGTTSASPTFAQATTAGNLLIAPWAQDAGTAPVAPAGWSRSDNSIITCFYKENCGASESAPTFTSSGSAFCAVVLIEFSGAATSSALDQDGTTGGTTSPQVAVAGAVDGASGSLIVSSSIITYSMAATKTTSDTYNNGASVVNAGNNDATSTANHYRFGYGITTGNASADQDSLAFTTTNITNASVRVVSFKPFAAFSPVDPMGMTGFFGG